MASSAAKVLSHASSMRARWWRRYDTMTEALIERFQSPPTGVDAEWTMRFWSRYIADFEDLVERLDRAEPTVEGMAQLEAIMRRGYQMLLIERDTSIRTESIPTTQEEWDQLPDPLMEMRRRLRAVGDDV